jgi:hypothetical protein
VVDMALSPVQVVADEISRVPRPTGLAHRNPVWVPRSSLLLARAGLCTHVSHYRDGTLKSLQIFLARSSLISEWRGTAEVLPAARLT